MLQVIGASKNYKKVISNKKKKKILQKLTVFHLLFVKEFLTDLLSK